MSVEKTDGAGVRPVTTTAQPTSEPAQPARPGSPVATSPSGIQPRPVPRPGGPPMSSGNRDSVDTKPVTTSSQPGASGRSVPQPSQSGVQTSPAVRGEPANGGHPGPWSVQTSGAGNMESPRPSSPSSPRPGASTGVIRPSVENRPSAPRAPQSVSMPRSEPAPQRSSHARTVVQAPRENTRHENKAQQSKREEKPERKPNR